VPVWQDCGHGRRELAAVLALAAASPRFQELGEASVAERLLEAADTIGERLSGTGVARGKRRPGQKRSET
jgi:hypothetical protein